MSEYTDDMKRYELFHNGKPICRGQIGLPL